MKKQILWIFLIILSLSSCKTKTNDSSESSNTSSSDLIVNPDALVEMDINVDGMTCTGCENTINTGLSEIPGIVEVKSSYLNGITFVKFDSTQANIEKISEVIVEKGYAVDGYSIHNQDVNPSTDTN